MERLREVPVPVGGRVKTPDGGTLTAQYLDPSVAKRDSVRVGKVPKYEAEHVVVAENLGTEAVGLTIISEEEGRAQFAEPNAIASATHIGDGDAIDSLIVINLGMEPSEAASLANREKARAQDEIDEVAKEAALRRELSGPEIRRAMVDGRKGREVVIRRKDAKGNKIREERTRVKGPIAIVHDMTPNKEYDLPIAA